MSEEMNAVRQREELKQKTRKPLNGRLIALLNQIEKRPALFVGSDSDLRALFHFLNGWQCAMGGMPGCEDANLNERMNVFVALKYGDFDSLNWADLLIRHEGEAAAVRKFFECFHEMQR